MDHDGCWIMMGQNGWEIDDIWKTKAIDEVSLLPALSKFFYSLLRGCLFLNNFTLRCCWDAGSVGHSKSKRNGKSEDFGVSSNISVAMKTDIGFLNALRFCCSKQIWYIPILSQPWPGNFLQHMGTGSIKTTCSVGLAWILASQRLNWARFCCVEYFMAAHLLIATFELTTSFVRKCLTLYILVANIPFLVASSNRKHVESQRAALPVALWGLWRLCRLDRLCFATANQRRSQDQTFFLCRVNLVGGFKHLLKNISQWEGLSDMFVKKNVPNHQPAMVLNHNQQTCFIFTPLWMVELPTELLGICRVHNMCMSKWSYTANPFIWNTHTMQSIGLC